MWALCRPYVRVQIDIDARKAENDEPEMRWLVDERSSLHGPHTHSTHARIASHRTHAQHARTHARTQPHARSHTHSAARTQPRVHSAWCALSLVCTPLGVPHALKLGAPHALKAWCAARVVQVRHTLRLLAAEVEGERTKLSRLSSERDAFAAERDEIALAMESVREELRETTISLKTIEAAHAGAGQKIAMLQSALTKMGGELEAAKSEAGERRSEGERLKGMLDGARKELSAAKAQVASLSQVADKLHGLERVSDLQLGVGSSGVAWRGVAWLGVAWLGST